MSGGGDRDRLDGRNPFPRRRSAEQGTRGARVTALGPTPLGTLPPHGLVAPLAPEASAPFTPPSRHLPDSGVHRILRILSSPLEVIHNFPQFPPTPCPERMPVLN